MKLNQAIRLILTGATIALYIRLLFNNHASSAELITTAYVFGITAGMWVEKLFTPTQKK